MSDWTHPKGLFPGIMDYEREVIAGTVVRQACEHDPDDSDEIFGAVIRRFEELAAAARLRASGTADERLREDADRYRYLREWALRVRREETMGGRIRPFLTMQEIPLSYDAPTGRGDAVDTAVDASIAALAESRASLPSERARVP